MLDRVDYFFARRLADHLHPPAFSGTVVIAKPKCPELINTCTARATAVQYRRRGADVAGYRGRGARARRVDHAYAPSPPEGARRSEAEHSSCRCGGAAVSQGVRARGRREKGWGHDSACEAEMSTCASSRLSPPDGCPIPVNIAYVSPF